jgi:hypothetical protein
MWSLRKLVRPLLRPRPNCISNLPLPSDLIALIEAGRWRCPADLSGVDRLFPDRGEFKLYTLDYMPFENRWWITRIASMFLGSPDPVQAPGDIDPELSDLIGDLGMGCDQPIALDYRPSMEDPAVLTFEWSDTGRDNRWVKVASNIREFADQSAKPDLQFVLNQRCSGPGPPRES